MKRQEKPVSEYAIMFSKFGYFVAWEIDTENSTETQRYSKGIFLAKYGKGTSFQKIARLPLNKRKI